MGWFSCRFCFLVAGGFGYGGLWLWRGRLGGFILRRIWDLGWLVVFSVGLVGVSALWFVVSLRRMRSSGV